MSTPNAIIEVRDLVTKYGSRRILDGVNIRVPEGLITVILGGSGSGKSTLLRHLIGLQRPTGGEILVKGRDIGPLTADELVEMRKRMGILFQSGALFNSMTVGENVALPLR
ncbi:MAG TPA: ATP-binding cassette domain-containing protein, partial [Candidatus Acidoferrum sp.]|nr:ATP-binding cassette domain-containing protein [Candidatus Acidoferrum sp.]